MTYIDADYIAREKCHIARPHPEEKSTREAGNTEGRIPVHGVAAYHLGMETVRSPILGNFVPLLDAVRAVANCVPVSDEEADACRWPDYPEGTTDFELLLLRGQVKPLIAQARAAAILLQHLERPGEAASPWRDAPYVQSRPRLIGSASEVGMQALIVLSGRRVSLPNGRWTIPADGATQGIFLDSSVTHVGFDIDELIRFLASVGLPNTLGAPKPSLPSEDGRLEQGSTRMSMPPFGRALREPVRDGMQEVLAQHASSVARLDGKVDELIRLLGLTRSSGSLGISNLSSHLEDPRPAQGLSSTLSPSVEQSPSDQRAAESSPAQRVAESTSLAGMPEDEPQSCQGRLEGDSETPPSLASNSPPGDLHDVEEAGSEQQPVKLTPADFSFRGDIKFALEKAVSAVFQAGKLDDEMAVFQWLRNMAPKRGGERIYPLSKVCEATGEILLAHREVDKPDGFFRKKQWRRMHRDAIERAKKRCSVYLLGLT